MPDVQLMKKDSPDRVAAHHSLSTPAAECMIPIGSFVTVAIFIYPTREDRIN